MCKRNNIVNDEIFFFLGLEDEDNKRLLDFLIKSHNDLKLFMQEFYSGQAVKDIMAFKEWIKQNNIISFEYFEQLFLYDRQNALEILFQEPVNKLDIAMIDKYSISYRTIYNNSMLVPHESLTNIIRGNFVQAGMESDNFLIE